MYLLGRFFRIARHRRATFVLTCFLLSGGLAIWLSGFMSPSPGFQARTLSKLKEKAMLNKPLFENQTSSLQLTEVITSDYEREVKDKNGVLRIFKLRSYTLTLKNSSTMPIDGIIFSLKQGDAWKGIHTLFYRYSNSNFAPQTSIKHTIQGIPIEETLSIATVVFTNNSFEGDAHLAQDLLDRWEGARLKLLEIQPTLDRLDKTPEASLAVALQHFIQQLRQEKLALNSSGSPSNTETERRQARARLGAIDIVEHTLHELNTDPSSVKAKSGVRELLRWTNEKIEQLNRR